MVSTETHWNVLLLEQRVRIFELEYPKADYLAR